jgi:hypothetical protein
MPGYHSRNVSRVIKGWRCSSRGKALAQHAWSPGFNSQYSKKKNKRWLRIYSFLGGWGTVVWTHGLELARQALYHLGFNTRNPLLTLFLRESPSSRPGWPQTTILHSCTAGVQTCTTTPSLLRWVLANFFFSFSLGWPQTLIHPILLSQLAGITDVSHYMWPRVYF